MLETRLPTRVVAVAVSEQRKRTTHSDALFWVAGIVLAFIVPLFLVLAAVFVSSWGIPLPVYVAVP
jgi:hypothetical protein